jgi:hypothetical protein
MQVGRVVTSTPDTRSPATDPRHERGGYDPTLLFACCPEKGAHHHDCAVCAAYFDEPVEAPDTRSPLETPMSTQAVPEATRTGQIIYDLGLRDGSEIDVKRLTTAILNVICGWQDEEHCGKDARDIAAEYVRLGKSDDRP